MSMKFFIILLLIYSTFGQFSSFTNNTSFLNPLFNEISNFTSTLINDAFGETIKSSPTKLKKGKIHISAITIPKNITLLDNNKSRIYFIEEIDLRNGYFFLIELLKINYKIILDNKEIGQGNSEGNGIKLRSKKHAIIQIPSFIDLNPKDIESFAKDGFDKCFLHDDGKFNIDIDTKVKVKVLGIKKWVKKRESINKNC